jgi:hypothetical protein
VVDVTVENWRDLNAVLAALAFFLVVVDLRRRWRTVPESALFFLLALLGFLAAVVVRAFVGDVVAASLSSSCVAWVLIGVWKAWRSA